MKTYWNSIKKFAALLLTLFFIFSFIACDSNDMVNIDENALSTVESSTADATHAGEDEPYHTEEASPEAVPESGNMADDEDDKLSVQIETAEPSPFHETDSHSELSPIESSQSDITTVEEPHINDGLTPTQRNSINMLNYMTALTQRVNQEKGNQLFLESAYNSFDNLYPNAVDTKTQAQITSLMDTIQNYRMISVKRDRLEYIYEQNRAKALRQAIPNPLGLLSAVQSGSKLKMIVAVLYMAADSASSYQAATSQADLQYIKDGWELDDEESAELHNSTKNALTYLLNMVRDYDLPGDYALSREAVEDFVLWSSKPDSQRVSKISWFESHQDTYSEFGPYWLELAKYYYDSEEYEQCLSAIGKYESVTTRIFRKNIDYASVLPMAIVSAKQTMSKREYIKAADQYCTLILKNTKDSDWALRYFTAQIYLDLYSITDDAAYLDKSYQIAFDNVVVLVDGQRELNKAYIADVQEVKAEKDATKREKQEIKNYNRALKEERKIALPPVSEALYLNCDLLFALAEKKNIPATEKNRIEAVLHENGEDIFLTKALDNKFRFGNCEELNADKIDITFDGKTLTIPAIVVTDRSVITVTITGSAGITILEDWTVDSVKRPKKAGVSDFIATFSSKTGKDYKYQEGELVTITVIPVAETPDESVAFMYNVVGTKIALVFNGIKFERITK